MSVKTKFNKTVSHNKNNKKKNEVPELEMCKNLNLFFFFSNLNVVLGILVLLKRQIFLPFSDCCRPV